ncbi:MAG: hypothetical protein M1829_005189 [Trizodia sp. TS-e1964]|nr:MAG: hypothetical protein M1829_005189 [Trizodia sp. TS-e1964]
MPAPARPSPATRLRYFLGLYALKAAVRTLFFLSRLLAPLPRAQRPAFTKTYACRPSLTNRFFPPLAEKGGTPPLYISIHGGGFALCDAQSDDEFCAAFGARTGALVVSIEYRKAPRWRFPTAVHDVAAVVAAILDDPALCFDRSKVAVGGFSAGGNLALAAAQLDGLRGRVKAAVTFYPVLDWTIPGEEKLAQHPETRGGFLARMAPYFTWGYVGWEQDAADPLLSPTFARRKDLPEWLYFVAAEHDFLETEARVMARKMAGRGEEKEREDAWVDGKVRWECVKGYGHSFTHFDDQGGHKKVWKKTVNDLYERITRWMLDEAFA